MLCSGSGSIYTQKHFEKHPSGFKSLFSECQACKCWTAVWVFICVITWQLYQCYCCLYWSLRYERLCLLPSCGHREELRHYNIRVWLFHCVHHLSQCYCATWGAVWSTTVLSLTGGVTTASGHRSTWRCFMFYGECDFSLDAVAMATHWYQSSRHRKLLSFRWNGLILHTVWWSWVHIVVFGHLRLTKSLKSFLKLLPETSLCHHVLRDTVCSCSSWLWPQEGSKHLSSLPTFFNKQPLLQFCYIVTFWQ